ncbi:MAG: hypothetical protein COA73_05475 [Candidatus Hydrogenedentota bacterium]|nr:MAG: hypothetical protein COA73_05475 [Candidatus Hydrogenedentota bacterium]
MIFVKTFKGYEDRTADLDKLVNEWLAEKKVDVVSVQTVLSHEPSSRAKSGDLLYTVVYKADAPIQG